MKTGLRIRANKAKKYRCKNLIVVLENPKHIENIGSTLRNIDALGAQKLYVIDRNNLLPKNWQEMRERRSLNKISASAIRWSFVRRFDNTEQCLQHLQKKQFVSVVTSPHQKGKKNFLLEDGKYTMPRLAVWFGNEGQGITEQAVEKSKFCINIPMCGIIESLNLGTTTGIVLYEITKQRRRFVERKEKRLNERNQV